MKTLYSKKVIEHFLNPKFFGKINNPDGLGEAGNIRCGDIMKLYLKVNKKTEKIKDIRFETLGCAAALAASDILCEKVRGKKIDEAEKIKFEEIVKEMGKIPPIKVHCSILATRALKKAIEDYRKKKKRP